MMQIQRKCSSLQVLIESQLQLQVQLQHFKLQNDVLETFQVQVVVEKQEDKNKKVCKCKAVIHSFLEPPALGTIQGISFSYIQIIGKSGGSDGAGKDTARGKASHQWRSEGQQLVAARAGSYAQAGLELGLTHGAVSRQVAAPEAWLGQRLFVRVGRRMVATPAARAFAEEVSLSFDRLTAAAETCGRPQAPRVLRVSAPSTFAMRWLIPRLDRFHAARPGTV